MSNDWKVPCLQSLWEGKAGVTICAATWCCPCIIYGINVAKLDDAPADANVFFAGQFTMPCVVYCCLAGYCPCIVHIPTRQYIRKKYSIKEPEHGILEDLFMTWCCGCCSLAQEFNELIEQSSRPYVGIGAELAIAKAGATKDVSGVMGNIKSKAKELTTKDEKPKDEKEETKA